MQAWDCKSQAANGSWEIAVSMLGRDTTHIRSVVATVFDCGASPDNVRAKDFLASLAELAYDDGSPAEARQWVDANLATGAETTYGSAKFTIYGNPRARTLEMVAIGTR